MDPQYKSLVVVFEHEVSAEEALATMRAIRLLRGVSDVQPCPVYRPQRTAAAAPDSLALEP